MGNSVRVDQKGRFKIPVNLLRGTNNQFYVTSESGDSIRIYPMQVWNRVERRLGDLCPRNRNCQKLLARAKYFGRTISLDNQGRVLIPIALRRSAQIRGSVDVLDYVNYLEVWNHARFLRNLRSDPITAQDESMLNRQLSSVVSFPRTARTKKRHTHALQGARSEAAKHARVA